MNLNDLFGNSLVNKKYQNNLVIGRIIDTHYDINLSNNEFQTIDVSWITGQIYVSKNIPITYNNVSMLGYGIQFLPSVGDYIIASFLPGGIPLILGYSKFNPLKNTGKEINSYGDPTDGIFRQLVEGEYSIQSKKQAELYFDDNGNIHIITRKQDKQNKYYGDRIIEITIGENIDNSNSDEKIQFELKNYQTNTRIIINSEGEVKIEADKIILGDSLTQPAVLGNDLKSLLQTIISVFNQHTHTTPSGMTSTPVENMEYEDILSETVEVK